MNQIDKISNDQINIANKKKKKYHNTRIDIVTRRKLQ